MSDALSDLVYSPMTAFSGASNFSIKQSTISIIGGNLIQETGQSAAEKLGLIANWVGQLNFRVIHSDALAKRTPGTGAWFLCGEEFEEWLSRDGTALWITGMPGAGKSVLCSSVINYIETELCRAANKDAIIFAYCRYTDHHTARDIFASLVRQLLERHPFILPILEPVYQKHIREQTPLSREDLVDLLQMLIPHFRRVFIAVDALDEVSDDTKLELLKGLASLPPQARLFLASRELESFTYLVPRRILVSITNRNQADIDVFITTKIAETPRFAELFRGKEALKEEVCEQIKVKSLGMFLVAALQIESLKRCTTVKKLRVALNALPVGVHAMYQATWARIEAQSPEEVLLAKRAILWVAYGIRNLQIVELQEALAICGDGDLEDGEFDEEDVPPANLILALCCGLLTVGEGEIQVVRLVHYTALDFVQTLTEDMLSGPHTFLGTSCVIYLRAFDFPQVVESISKVDGFYKLLASQPLIEYAYQNWGIHAHKAYHQEKGLPKLVRDFFCDFSLYPWGDASNDSRFDILDLVHVAAYYGLPDLFEECIERDPLLVDSRSHILKVTPLMCAAGMGHSTLVKSLWNRSDCSVGVDVNAQNWWGETALILASGSGYEKVVYILLYPSIPAARIDVHLETYRNPTTALILAAQAGHESIVKMLLQYDPTINLGAEDAGGNTALSKACQDGNVGVVRALVSSPSQSIADDIYRRNNMDNSPLYYAVSNDYVDIVRLLLGHGGVNINERFQRDMGMTPFLYACWAGNETLARMFLDYSKKQKGGMAACLAAEGRTGHTCLTLAAWKGKYSLASMLLQYTGDGVNINARDDDGNTALLAASQEGYEDIVKLLLSRTIAGGYEIDEVDTHAANRAGDTPILAAKNRGHVAIVEILRAHGADEGKANAPPKLSTYAQLELFVSRF